MTIMNSYARYPITIVRGEGCYLWDSEGKRYLDFVAGIATCSLGHAHPAIIDAAHQQLKSFHHVSNLYFTTPQVELAKFLVETSALDQVFFCNSGAEANEAAIKLVRKYAHTVRCVEEPVIITAEQSFHGRTLATITATGQPKYQKGFAPLMPGFEYVPYNDDEALKKKVAEIGARKLIAIMMEPIQGEGGVRPATASFLETARELCDQTGALLIFDEVQCGNGRSGTLWAYEQYGVVPDILTTAKGIAGGIPLGAMLAKNSFSIFEPGDHATTYGGNPFATAVGLAVCKIINEPTFLANIKKCGEMLRERLSKLADKYPETVQEVRGMGLINGIVLKDSSPLTAPDIVKTAMAQNLLVLPAGPKVVRLVPPLIITEAQIVEACGVLEKVFSTLSTSHKQ
jgi:acetylornithine/N-succinyldiaminopimelate aminotransferase